MTAETWTADVGDARSTLISTWRSFVRSMVWGTVIVGPLIIGGLAGWIATSEERFSDMLNGAVGALPLDTPAPIVSEAELNAVGLDPRTLRQITRP